LTTTTGDPHNGAETLALYAFDTIADPASTNKHALRLTAISFLKETWRTPRPPLTDAAREIAFAVIAWVGDDPEDGWRKLRKASCAYETLRLKTYR
jgi:hypothetical protein